MWSTWRAVHSCNCDRKLAMNSLQTFISGYHFEPDMIFRLLTPWPWKWAFNST